MQTDDIAAWLTQVLDEDEADTRALTVAGIESGWESWIESGQSVGDKTGYVVAYEVRLGAARRHIARNDPASVLARFAADRAILAAWQTARVRSNEWGTVEVSDDPVELEGIATGLKQAVLIVAAQYADRPGYKEQWRP